MNPTPDIWWGVIANEFHSWAYTQSTWTSEISRWRNARSSLYYAKKKSRVDSSLYKIKKTNRLSCQSKGELSILTSVHAFVYRCSHIYLCISVIADRITTEDFQNRVLIRGSKMLLLLKTTSNFSQIWIVYQFLKDIF